MPISDKLKQAIRERAKYICEYCHSPEQLSANRFSVDHVIPKSLGGSDDLDNFGLKLEYTHQQMIYVNKAENI